MCRSLAFLAVPVVAAMGCGEIKTIAGEDGGAESDADPSPADAGNPSDPLNGSWQWWIGDDPENPDSTCDVTIGGGAFEVYCPSDPYEVGTNCTKTKNDTRIQGTWGVAFAGSFDQIERYEGIGCPELGYPDVDMDLVTPGVLVMEADHAEASDAGGFLALASGRWDWSMWDPDDTANPIACAVTFEPASADTTAFRVECLQDPTSPIPDCTATEALIIEGTLDDAGMTSAGWEEERYEGAGCDPTYPDPVVEGDHSPMGAVRQ